MSLRVKSLNSDSSFLLVFSPPYAPHNPQGTFPGSFTILLDPWLSGPSKVWSERFALTTHNVQPCVESIAELPEPDMVIISQDKTDHCHQDTLQQLPRDTPAIILGTPSAARKIKTWKHFDPDQVESLKRFDEKRPETIFRVPIKPVSPTGSAGEITVSLVTSKMDVTGLHNAIGITYRPPSSVLSTPTSSYVNLPPTPPASPPYSPTNPFAISSPTLSPASTTLFPPPVGNREKTLSVLYSPHGVDYEVVRSYASAHLLPEGALPLNVLLHSFNRLCNPWYMGGNVCAGYPSGIEIASNLFAKAWISAHDEEKTITGVGVMGLKFYKAELDEVGEKLRSFQKGPLNSNSNTFLCSLGAGEEYHLSGK